MSEKIKCPNCGADLPADTIQCEFCGFVIADTESLEKIDNFIVELHRNITEMHKVSNLKSEDMLLIVALPFLWGGVFLGIFPLILIAFPLTIVLFAKKSIRTFFSRYPKLKRKFDKNYNEFSKLYPKNYRLAEIKKEFDERVLKYVSKVMRNFAFAFFAFLAIIIIQIGILISGVFISKKNSGDNIWSFPDTVVVLVPQEIYLSSQPDSFRVLNNRFYCTFDGVQVSDSAYVKVSSREIYLQPVGIPEKDSLMLQLTYLSGNKEAVDFPVQTAVFSTRPQQGNNYVTVEFEPIIMSKDVASKKMYRLTDFDNIIDSIFIDIKITDYEQ